MVCEAGAVLVYAPPSLSAFIPKAIAEITSKPITHIVCCVRAARNLG